MCCCAAVVCNVSCVPALRGCPARWQGIVRVVAVLSLGQCIPTSDVQLYAVCVHCRHILVGGRVDKGNERGGAVWICAGPPVYPEIVIYTFGTAWRVLYSDWARQGREGEVVGLVDHAAEV